MPVWRVELYESDERKVPKKVGHIRAMNEVAASDAVVAEIQKSELKHADIILTTLPEGAALPRLELNTSR